MAPKRVADYADIVRLKEEGHTHEDIGHAVGMSKSGVTTVLVKLGFRSRQPNCGRHLRRGYVMVQPPDGFPYPEMLHSNGYLPEHRYLVAMMIGRPLTRTETVHHINGDTADNRLTNLQLRWSAHGEGVAYQCRECGSVDIEAVKL